MFENIGTEGYIVFGVIVLAILIWILYAVIKSAVSAANRDQVEVLKTQAILLAKLLEKQGVSKAEIEQIVKAR